MIQPGEPDELDLTVQRARKRYDNAWRDLTAAIDAEFEAGRGPSRVARYAGFSREHIAKIHASGQMPSAPRRRSPKPES